MNNIDRKHYEMEFKCDTIELIKMESDYQSTPSIIVNKDNKRFEFHYLFERPENFTTRIRIGDKISKASKTFNFILLHQDGCRDTVFVSAPWQFSLFFMPNRNIFRKDCP